MATIKRIDPHLERIKRNRLHPRHHDVVNSLNSDERPAASYMGPNGIIRKNPHNIGFTGPNGLKRIDRINLNQSAHRQEQAKTNSNVEEQKPLHIVANPTSYIVVVPDLAAGRLSSHDKDVLGFARQLADTQENSAVMAIAFGSHKETGWKDSGVDRLLDLGLPERNLPELNSNPFQGYCPEAQLSALKQLEEHIQIAHFLFPDSVDNGADLGRRLSAELTIRPITHGWKWQDNTVICRAGAGTLDLPKALSKVMLLDAEIADPTDEHHYQAIPPELNTETLVTNVLTQRDSHLTDQGLLAVDPADISLAESPFILSGGNGIRDWQTFHDAAHILGATEGASRVAVDDGFMPRHRQVGATGTWVTARVYIAVGISGAVQHLQGIAQVDKVIAINTSSGCDMVKRADLSIIADSTDILTALIEAGSDNSQTSPHITPPDSPSNTLQKGDSSHHAA